MEAEFITEELDVDWDSQPEVMKSLDEEIRAYYGMGATEYINLRNKLVREYDYKLPYEVFEKQLFNKAMIDLIGRGLLSVNVHPTTGLCPKITEKGYAVIHQAIADGDICPAEDDGIYALYHLRNRNLLRK